MTHTFFFLAAHEVLVCQTDNLTVRLSYICQCITQPQHAIIWQEMALSTEQHRNTLSLTSTCPLSALTTLNWTHCPHMFHERGKGDRITNVTMSDTRTADLWRD